MCKEMLLRVVNRKSESLLGLFKREAYSQKRMSVLQLGDPNDPYVLSSTTPGALLVLSYRIPTAALGGKCCSHFTDEDTEPSGVLVNLNEMPKISWLC